MSTTRDVDIVHHKHADSGIQKLHSLNMKVPVYRNDTRRPEFVLATRPNRTTGSQAFCHLVAFPY